MARHAHTTPVTPVISDADYEASEPEFRSMVAAATAERADQDARVEAATALAVRVAYDGELTVAAIDDGIRLYQRRTVEDCLELGKRLLLRRELTPYGEFDAVLDAHGFARRTGYRFMSAALRTASSANLALLARSANTASKMLELLTLDDDEAGELLAGGAVRGLVLDDVETMPASALRRALREARAESAAKDKVLAAKSATIDKLATEAEAAKQTSLIVQVPIADRDAVRQQIIAELCRRTADVEMEITTGLLRCIQALRQHADEGGRPAEDYIAGALCQVRTALADLEDQTGIQAMPGEAARLWELTNADYDARVAAEAESAPPPKPRPARGTRRGKGSAIADFDQMPTHWARADNPTLTYTDGDPVPDWMRAEMVRDGYDPQLPDDIAAYCPMYLVPLHDAQEAQS